MEDLKGRAVRGGFAKLCGQAANMGLRIGFVAVMARLLDPEDFGLVAMVTVVTGVYEIFTSAGLSMATIQKASVTDEQISTLFWVNILVGAVLCLLCLATAPVLVSFYHEPRLFWVTVALGVGFVITGGGVQHSALLQRQLRYVDLTMIEMVSLLVKLCTWNNHGCRWVWILGSRRCDCRFGSHQYHLDVGDRGLDTKHAASGSGGSIDVAFWRHDRSE